MVVDGATPGEEQSPKTAISSSSSRLGLLQCPNAKSLGWGSRPSGNVVAAAEAVTDNSGNLQGGSREGPIVSNLPMATKADEVFVSVSTRNKTSKPSALEPSTSFANDEVGADAIIDVLPSKDKPGLGEKSSRKRPRVSISGTSKQAVDIESSAKGSFHDAENVSISEPSSSTKHNLPHVSVKLDCEQRIDSSSVGSCQILTITYHAEDDDVNNTLPFSPTTVVGTISGRAKIDLLPTFSETTHDTKMDASSCGEEVQHTSILSLDIFGYRISQQTLSSSNDNHIIINRPSWMNSLPISVVHESSKNNHTERSTTRSVLRVRIQSIVDDSSVKVRNSSSGDDGDCYYSAYPQQSYNIRILPSTGIYPGNYIAAGSGVCTVLESWKHTLDKIIYGIADDSNSHANGGSTTNNDNKLSENNDIILLCGAKGVGKSNLLRYSTNRLLTASRATLPTEPGVSRVAILDLDCGQAELSPPGVLSLTIMSKPLLSDPPVHMICGGSCDHYGRKIKDNNPIDEEDFFKHEASYFFGETSSKSDPDTFIQMASQLMQRYRLVVNKLGVHLPLLINTDGWVKGLGYEILCAIIGAINPGHIIQIMGNTKAKSFDMSSHHQYAHAASKNEQSQYQSRIVHIIQSFDESLFSIENDDDRCRRRSMDSRNSIGTQLATASDHRVHRLCAYFLGGYNEMINLRSSISGEDETISFHKEKGLHDPNDIIGLTLCSMAPYAVPFHSVRIYPPAALLDGITELRPLWGMQGDLMRNDVLDYLNGSIVGLCCNPDAIDLPLSNCNFGTGVPVLSCVGLGIIRSVDYSRRLFFVLTPVHPRLLTSVTSFVGGKIILPLECVYRGVYSDSFPFMSCDQLFPRFRKT